MGGRRAIAGATTRQAGHPMINMQSLRIMLVRGLTFSPEITGRVDLKLTVLLNIPAETHNSGCPANVISVFS